MNFDHPDSLESGLLVEHVAALKRGEEIRHPVYDFTTHTRISGKYETVTAGDYLIVEGLFTFYWPELREIFDSRIFIATVDPICFGRRKQRDVAERGRSPESIVAQYNKTVRPGNEAFIVPTAAYADLVVNGEQPIEESSQQIFEFVQQRVTGR
jgi:uridine kinase